MKKIEAVVLPSRVGAIRAELERRGIFAGLTLTKVQHGDPHDHPTTVRNGSAGGLKRRIKLELIVGDRQAEKAVSVILRHALTDSSETDGHVSCWMSMKFFRSRIQPQTSVVPLLGKIPSPPQRTA
jgi:nitrogen regulatory protein PII